MVDVVLIAYGVHMVAERQLKTIIHNECECQRKTIPANATPVHVNGKCVFDRH